MRDDWFSRLTGFNEGPYSTTRELLEVNGSTLRSKVNDRSFCIGQFEMPSLADLRLRVAQGTGASGPNRVSIVTGDVRKMHQIDRKSTRLNSSHSRASRMPSSA